MTLPLPNPHKVAREPVLPEGPWRAIVTKLDPLRVKIPLFTGNTIEHGVELWCVGTGLAVDDAVLVQRIGGTAEIALTSRRT